MTKYSTSNSFVVRVYRIDTDDYRKVTGLVEAMDGSGERDSFADADELAALLHRLAAGSQHGSGQKKRQTKDKGRERKG